MSSFRGLGLRATALLAGVAAALLVGEGFARLLGYRPWPTAAVDEGPPLRHDADPRLGWIPRAGNHRLPLAGAEPARELDVTVWDDRSRATGPHPRAEAPDILILGGSYTFGQDLSDSDTYPWLLQERLPDRTIRNLGVNAYGTLQAARRLERYLEDSAAAPRWVVYGFFDHHQYRNVATWSWLLNLEIGNVRGVFQVPYAMLDDGGRMVEPEAAAGWVRLPLRAQLALVPILERGLVRWETRGREQDAFAVTTTLFERLQQLAASRGARLLVAGLDWSQENRVPYRRFLKSRRIPWVHCAPEHLRTPESRVQGGTQHPNRRVHEHWADCLAGRLTAVSE